MESDEHQIRSLIDTWIRETKAGNSEAILDLMTDDVVFLTVGAEPFGKEVFVAAKENGDTQMEMEGTSEVLELQIFGSNPGDLACTRTHLALSITNKDGSVTKRAGYILSVFKKGDDGKWRLYRDANLLVEK